MRHENDGTRVWTVRSKAIPNQIRENFSLPLPDMNQRPMDFLHDHREIDR